MFADLAALKAEDPHRFFGTWLAKHGLTFGDAALIDDRADNCDAFANCGGTPIQYKMTTDDIGDVTAALKTRLDQSHVLVAPGRHGDQDATRHPCAIPGADSGTTGWSNANHSAAQAA